MRCYPQAVVLAIGILAISGCDRNEGVLPKTAGDPQQQASQAENRGTVSQSERDAYMASARQEIDQLQGKLDELKAKSENLSAELKSNLEARIRDFQDDMKIIIKKWENLQGASAATWKDMKNSLNESIENLRKAIQREIG